MSIKLGENTGIYVGGWFSNNSNVITSIDYFTGGWYESFTSATIITDNLTLEFLIPNPRAVATTNIFPNPLNLYLTQEGVNIIGLGNISADVLGMRLGPNIPNIFGYGNILPDPLNAYILVTSATVIINNGIVRITSAVPINIIISPYDKVTTSMFGDFTGGFSMGNGTNMPNGWLTKCDTKYNNERRMFDKIISESIKQLGVCLDFYVTTWNTQYDKIWGEDNDRRFVRRFAINAYYTLPREEKLWTKFGIEGTDNFSMFVSKEHLKLASLYDYERKCRKYNNTDPITGQELGYIPKIGDILISNYNNYIYEITEVKEETGQYLLSNQHVWELIVKPFKDEHLTLSPDTSASMSYIKNYIDKDTDIFDVKTVVDQKKTAVNYAPKATEKNSSDPYGGW